MKKNGKKKVALAIVFFILSTGIISAATTIDERQPDSYENNALTNEPNKGYVRYTLMFSDSKTDLTNQHSINYVDIPIKEAQEFENKLLDLKKQAQNEKNPEKIKDLTKESLKLYREFGILPQYFTYENMTEFVDELSTSFFGSFVQSKKENRLLTTNTYDSIQTNSIPGGLTLNFALPISCLSYFNMWGAVNPFGISHFGGRVFKNAIPIINITSMNVIFNSSGIYITNHSLPENGLGFGKWLESIGPIELKGTLWKQLWEAKGNDSYVQYKMFWGFACYNFMEILVGNAISYGMFTGLQVDGRYGTVKVNQPFFGNFLYFGSPYTFPFSFTLYKTWPEPWTVVFEVGVVPCLGISGLMSLLYLQPQ